MDPARATLPHDGRIRRVPGLRREEVALLAGVSTDYYARLEQGRRITPSDSVLDAIARALELDEAGRRHLVGATAGTSRRRAAAVQRVRPGLYRFLDTLDGHPAQILGRRNGCRPRDRNYARWMFPDDAPRTLFLDWDAQARACVENLRLDLGDHPDDRAANDLVAELSARSPEFRAWWEEHGVHQRTFGTKRLRHPVVGDLTVQYETSTMPGDRDQTLFVHTTEAATSSARRCTSWRAGRRRLRCPHRATRRSAGGSTGTRAGAPSARRWLRAARPGRGRRCGSRSTR